jgi:hypothetical protein
MCGQKAGQNCSQVGQQYRQRLGRSVAAPCSFCHTLFGNTAIDFFVDLFYDSSTPI